MTLTAAVIKRCGTQNSLHVLNNHVLWWNCYAHSLKYVYQRTVITIY